MVGFCVVRHMIGIEMVEAVAVVAAVAAMMVSVLVAPFLGLLS